jgi:hypothetical protein
VRGLPLVPAHGRRLGDDRLGLGCRLRFGGRGVEMGLEKVGHDAFGRRRDRLVQEGDGIAPIDVERRHRLGEEVCGFGRCARKRVSLAIGEHVDLPIVSISGADTEPRSGQRAAAGGRAHDHHGHDHYGQIGAWRFRCSGIPVARHPEVCVSPTRIEVRTWGRRARCRPPAATAGAGVKPPMR